MQLEGYSHIVERLNKIRQTLKPPPADEEELRRVYSALMECSDQVSQHVRKLSQAIELGDESFWEISDGKIVLHKTLLYLWQLLNYLVIGGASQWQGVPQLIESSLQASIQHEQYHPPNCLKNAAICILNYIKKVEQPKKHLQITEWVQQIIKYHCFSSSQSSLLQDKLTPKSEDVLTAQLEWISYIFEAYSQAHHPSPLQAIIQANEWRQDTYCWLHMLGNHLKRAIDLRTTTQLVQGLPSPLEEVLKMYQSKDTTLIDIKITQTDLIHLSKLAKVWSESLRSQIRYYLTSCNHENWNQNQWAVGYTHIVDTILQILHVLNSVLFLGGYNALVQNIVIPHLLKDDSLLGLFELAFLITRSMLGCGKQAKVIVLVEVGQQSQKKLHQMLQLPTPVTPLSLQQLTPLWNEGLLISSLRLLVNLVHINQSAQSVFEESTKYLHMVMSLTHESVQATLKEWAIMFIRNVAECSQKMREQIAKVKVEMKVTE